MLIYARADGMASSHEVMVVCTRPVILTVQIVRTNLRLGSGNTQGRIVIGHSFRVVLPNPG